MALIKHRSLPIKYVQKLKKAFSHSIIGENGGGGGVDAAFSPGGGGYLARHAG